MVEHEIKHVSCLWNIQQFIPGEEDEVQVRVLPSLIVTL